MHVEYLKDLKKTLKPLGCVDGFPLYSLDFWFCFVLLFFCFCPPPLLET